MKNPQELLAHLREDALASAGGREKDAPNTLYGLAAGHIEELQRTIAADNKREAAYRKVILEAIHLAAEIARGDYDNEGYQEEHAIQIVHRLSELVLP